MNLRADNSLSQLTDDQQAQLYDWIIASGFTAAQASLAVPAPDGFALKVHLTTLRRFYARYRAEHIAENLDLANAFAQGNSPASLDAGTASALREQAFDLATSPQLISSRYDEDFDHNDQVREDGLTNQPADDFTPEDKDREDVELFVGKPRASMSRSTSSMPRVTRFTS